MPVPVPVLLFLTLGLVLSPPTSLPAASQERIVLPGLDGGQLSAADLADGSTILIIWASWSPRCRDVVPRVNELAEAWSSQARVATVVFQEEPEAVRRYLEGKNLRVPVYLDTTGSFSKKHAVTTLPGLLIFDDGQAEFRGKLPANPDPVIERTLDY
ncbi:MAG: TlpA family protein disulfide reductase [bacterium]|nr:TlpA family protein disulfide reductase [bacterium]